jgi:hypothetical protein
VKPTVGSEVPGLKKWYYYTTRSDQDIGSQCTTGFQDAVDNWLYGDYHFLYSNWDEIYTKKGDRESAAKLAKAAYVTSTIKRYRCMDGNIDVGYFAFAADGKGHTALTFLCRRKSVTYSGANLLQEAYKMASKSAAKGGGKMEM